MKNGQSPYLEVPGGELMAKENGQMEQTRKIPVIMGEQRRHRRDPKALPRRTQMKMQETTH